MTIGDKISAGITIASGLGIAYALQMHKEGKQILSTEQLEKLNGKKLLIEAVSNIRKEIVNDISHLKQLDSGLDKIEFLEGRALDILGFENSDMNR